MIDDQLIPRQAHSFFVLSGLLEMLPNVLESC